MLRKCISISYVSIVIGLAAGHASAATMTILTNFSSSNAALGRYPECTLLLDGNDLYGTTYSGGLASNAGTIFKLPTSGGTVTKLADFNVTNGSKPLGDLYKDASGNLYGTASAGGAGGASGKGTVFKLASGSNTITVIESLTGPNGATPFVGFAADSSGSLYTTTTVGGASNLGAVIKLTGGAGPVNVVASFTGAANGSNPYGNLYVDGAGNIYGTARNGGANGVGTLFKIAAGGNTITTLATFAGASNGANPISDLTMDSSGNLYGTTNGGGASSLGTVFKFSTTTNTLTTLASFSFATGMRPLTGVLLDGAGNIFGIANGGGTNNQGTVYTLPAGSSTITPLIHFSTATGYLPNGGLVADALGNLYGTTPLGGPGGSGTVFKITGSGFVPVPEPTTLVLVAVSACLVLRRRIAR